MAWLWAGAARGIDWQRYSADNLDEAAGGAAILVYDVDPAAFGLGYEFNTRLRPAPWFGSSFATFGGYDRDSAAGFGEADMVLHLTLSQTWRVTPFVAGGMGYRFYWGGDDDGDVGVAGGDGYARRDDSHWLALAAGGLRWRMGGGRYVEMAVSWRQALLDLPPGESRGTLGLRLAFGAAP